MTSLVSDHMIAQVRLQIPLPPLSSMVCRGCKQPMGTDRPCVLTVFEDPTCSVTTSEMAILPSESIPVPLDCRWVALCHQDQPCQAQVVHERLDLMFRRVALDDVIWEAVATDNRSEYLVYHNSSALDIVRAYPECPLLIVHCVSPDQPAMEGVITSSVEPRATVHDYTALIKPLSQELSAPNTITSMVMEMPLVAANSLVVRSAAWSMFQMWGLFQKIAVVDVVMNARNLVPIKQLEALQAAAGHAFTPYVKSFIPSVMAHRITNLNSQDVNKTTWRVVVRLDIAGPVIDQLYLRFYQTFLHPDAEITPAFLTWSQTFANEVLQTTSINEQAALNDPNYLKGGGTIKREALKQAWVQYERDATWSDLNTVLGVFINRLTALSPTDPPVIIQQSHVNSQSVALKRYENGVEEQMFYYRINAQEVITRHGVQSSEQYYCLPMMANNLQCWRVDQLTREPPLGETINIPIMYVDETLHNKYMAIQGMVPVQLDALTMIYHINPSKMQEFNRAHIPSPLPTPEEIILAATAAAAPPAPAPAPALALLPSSNIIHPATFLIPHTIGERQNAPTASRLSLRKKPPLKR